MATTKAFATLPNPADDGKPGTAKLGSSLDVVFGGDRKIKNAWPDANVLVTTADKVAYDFQGQADPQMIRLAIFP